MGKPIRVVVDDHSVVRTALARALQIESGIETVGEAADGRPAVRLADEVAPDVIVMDVGIGCMGGTEATRFITALHPAVRVIGLSIHDGGWMSNAMLQAGASAHVEKTAPLSKLIAEIRSAVAKSLLQSGW